MMDKTLKSQLSLMMFLQYFIWGIWYVTLGTYMLNTLHSSAVQVGSAYATFSIAAIISPFFVGLIADRFFSSKYVLCTLHLLGAILLYTLSTVEQLSVFWWVILLYTLCYTPTIALSNSISFHKMKEPGIEFPKIRVLGTIGWIISGLLISYLGIEASAATFKIGAIASLLLALFSVSLPAVPPSKEKMKLSKILGLEAFVLFKRRSYVYFFIASILLCIPLAFYYNFANPFLFSIGVENAAAKMTLGQASEFIFMLAIPFFFTRLGVKKVFLIAMGCWVLRYVFFSFGDAESYLWLIIAGIFLHGICYDFFFVTGQIYTEKHAGASCKSAAQGLLTFATYGIGMFLGSYLSGLVTDYFSVTSGETTQYNWPLIWLVPAGFAGIVFLLFMLLFKEDAKTPSAVLTPSELEAVQGIKA